MIQSGESGPRACEELVEQAEAVDTGAAASASASGIAHAGAARAPQRAARPRDSCRRAPAAPLSASSPPEGPRPALGCRARAAQSVDEELQVHQVATRRQSPPGLTTVAG